MRFNLYLAAYVVLCCASGAWGATYTVVDLGPTGYLGYTFQATGAANGVQVGYGSAASDAAMMWRGTAASAVNLNPTNLDGSVASSSRAWGASGSQVVGAASGSGTSFRTHAVVWTNGTASSVVDLSPPNSGFTEFSEALGTSGGQQVGRAMGTAIAATGVGHAYLWKGTAASAVDLNPTSLNISDSYAWATNGTQQGGWGTGTGTGNASHALLWAGTAASAVDMNPAGSASSAIYAMSAGQQVGAAWGHATIWTGSAASAKDINPFGAAGSILRATNGTQQAGYATILGANSSYSDHATVWTGTAASAVDLQALLPAGFTSSQAYGIDDAGNVFGSAIDSSGSHVIVWAVPEPTSAACVVLSTATLFGRRRRGALRRGPR